MEKTRRIVYDKILGKSSVLEVGFVFIQDDQDRILIYKLDIFIKLIFDLDNIEVNIDDKVQALLLLCFLPKSYAHFKKLSCME